MRTFVGVVLFVAAAYFAVTGYAGYRVGSAIAEAERNPLAGIAARMVGREEIERFAVRKSNLPRYVTDSPSFWAALRASE